MTIIIEQIEEQNDVLFEEGTFSRYRKDGSHLIGD